MSKTIKTPGVYINEVNAFPNSVQEVPTAIPAFIGYTSRTEYEGKSYLNKPVKIYSMMDFLTFFGYADQNATQHKPMYYVSELEKEAENGQSHYIQGKDYAIEPDPATIYYLYNSIQLFYQNGGGEAYIVSVGSYGKPSGKAKALGVSLENPNVKLSELLNGLSALQKEPEVTMYVVPEATLLNKVDNSTLMQTMLKQNMEVRTAVSILDVKGGEAPDPKLYTEDIESFRTAVGSNGLSYGAVYYPFLITTVTAENQVSYHNVNNGDLEFLTNFVSNSGSPNAQALQIINTLKNHPDEEEEAQISSLLSSICLPYRQLMKIVVEKINTLPPSGAMAGIYTNVDNNSGVWKAPANVAVMSTSALTLNISESMQADLNVDALTGKSINAIRAFMGRGILVWGARTLDGNSPDWRYINVRRTITMIEQSIKLAMKAYIFELNDANTWIAIKSMISSFLYNIWKQGALQGAKSDDAFSISVGLGSSMTAEDIMNGTLRVIVKLAVVLPAEYIVISLEQQQQSS